MTVKVNKYPLTAFVEEGTENLQVEYRSAVNEEVKETRLSNNWYLMEEAKPRLKPCKVVNATTGGDFNITISPKYYMPYTHYAVKVSGFGVNATITLSAHFDGSAVGNWTNGSTTCDGIEGVRSMYTTEEWVSPMNITAYVNIRAFVSSMNGTYVQIMPLKQMPTTAPPTTTKAQSTTMVAVTTSPPATTTENSAPGMSSKPLQAFVCVLLLLVTVPGL
ncbi:uncharacterized protein LOC144608635 [Rhinoraja longicauda]